MQESDNGGLMRAEYKPVVYGLIVLLIELFSVSLFCQSIPKAIGMSSLSGFSLGIHESYTFGYTHDKWMPKFARDWYQWRPNTDAVFGKVFTMQKVFRDVDYAADRTAWNEWKKVFHQTKFFSWETLGAFGCHFLVKNTFATFIRDKMKHDKWFYSWQVELFFGEQLTDLFSEL